jgi:hypothetical protein
VLDPRLLILGNVERAAGSLRCQGQTCPQHRRNRRPVYDRRQGQAGGIDLHTANTHLRGSSQPAQWQPRLQTHTDLQPVHGDISQEFPKLRHTAFGHDEHG